MGTHPIFESDFDCLTDEMPASSAGVDGAHTHPLPNGVSYDDFNRIDSIRASQKKRRADDIRNKELSANQNLYQLSKNPPTVGLENAGFEVCWKILRMHNALVRRFHFNESFLGRDMGRNPVSLGITSVNSRWDKPIKSLSRLVPIQEIGSSIIPFKRWISTRKIIGQSGKIIRSIEHGKTDRS